MREDREQYVWWWLTNVGPWFALWDGPPPVVANAI